MMMILLLAAAVGAAQPQLLALLERVRLSVPDARQVSDLQLCPPEHVSRDGRKFTVLLGLNRPQVARRYYLAVWRDGRFVKLDDLSVTGVEGWGLGGDSVGLNAIATRAMERDFERRCRWVSADELAAGWAAVP